MHTVRFPLWVLVGAVLGGLTVGLWMRADRLHDEERMARDTVRVVDSIYVRDTITLTKWRDIVRVKRESLVVADTIQVKEFIALQDSAFTACTSALRTCERRVSARDTLIRIIEKRGKGPLLGSAFEGGWSWPATAPYAGVEVRAGTRFSVRARASATFGDTTRGRLDLFGRFEP